MYSIKNIINQKGLIKFLVLTHEKNFQKNILKICVRNYTPRRALLYVPGDSEKKIKSALNLNVDCIVMDCEDGVAINKKQNARDTIHSFLNEGKPSNAKFDWAVRVNPADNNLCIEDLKSVLTAKNIPDTIVLPKVDSQEDIGLFNDMFRNYNMLSGKKINLILLIESAIAMIHLPEICKYCISSKMFNLTSLIFGSDDFCASIGAIRTDDSKEILYARQKLVLVAKAYDLQAIDMVHINYKDLFSLKSECELAMRMGYTGKQVIHPAQVPVVQEAFLPNQKQVDWANGLIKAFNEYQKTGIGAFTYKDSMIDMPTLKIAKNIVNLVDQTKAYK